MTKLPPTIEEIYEEHRRGMTKVVKWLENMGIVIFSSRHILLSTCLDIHIRHDNDYIEMGPHTPDPEGVMFHVYTSQDVRFDVSCSKLSKVMRACKDHHFTGKKRIAKNVLLHTDVTNQFTMQKHLFANDFNWKKVELSLEFRVHHEFKEDKS